MSFVRDREQEERDEQARRSEVQWFYTSLIIFGSLFLFLFYVGTGVPWWRALMLDSEQYPFSWSRFAARVLTVPAPTLVGAFYLSDVRSWWAPLVYGLALLIFVVLLFLGTGVKFWYWGR